jgi:hypothetical protein
VGVCQILIEKCVNLAFENFDNKIFDFDFFKKFTCKTKFLKTTQFLFDGKIARNGEGHSHAFGVLRK